MKLDISKMREITQGTENIVYEDGKFSFFRFTSSEAEVIDNPNLLYTAGVQAEFETDGDVLSLKIITGERSGIRSYFSLEVFADGEFCGKISNLDEKDCVGNYADKTYPLGEYSGEIKLGEGKKKVRMVLPHSVVTEICEMEIENATYIEPVKRSKTLLAYGDSITQGYDSLSPINTYAFRLADYLDAEIYNKALGGAMFSGELVEKGHDLKPDYILTAYGTNDWSCVERKTFIENASAFFKALDKRYPDKPVCVITPIWRKGYENDTKFGAFLDVDKEIQNICKNYPNMTVVTGFELVEHRQELFGDLALHPNSEGFKCYFNNLIKYTFNK